MMINTGYTSIKVRKRCRNKLNCKMMEVFNSFKLHVTLILNSTKYRRFAPYLNFN